MIDIKPYTPLEKDLFVTPPELWEEGFSITYRSQEHSIYTLPAEYEDVYTILVDHYGKCATITHYDRGRIRYLFYGIYNTYSQLVNIVNLYRYGISDVQLELSNNDKQIEVNG